MGNKGTIILKPTQGLKIKHYNLLKNIEQSQQLKKDANTVLENYLDPRDNIILAIRWDYFFNKIGEYTYYYLSMKALDIKLNIVKKNDNSSIYVFLKYADDCHFLAAIILNKYLNNHWKISN